MKLNPDCIRDILLTIEERSDYFNAWEFDSLLTNAPLLKKYSYEEVIYHISQCNKSGLIDGCEIYLGAEAGTVSDLSPYGHQFLADIRSDNVWHNVKEVSQKVGSNSLQTLISIASGVVTEIIKSQLGLI